MQRLTAIIAFVVLGSSFISAGTALASPGVKGASSDESVVFRLRVSGSVASNSTFWAAYGPVAGRFGLVQLKPVGPGQFSGTTKLPPGQSGIVAYLAGHGVVRTRAGKVPGDPVVTIRRTGDVPFSTRTLPLVHWVATRG